MSRFHGRQAGFTLVEVMVAVIVISIGLLGVAAMQIVGLRDSNRSGERSLATVLAYDIVDRMRANKQGATGGFYRIDPATGSQPSAPAGADPLEHCKTDFTGTATVGICNSTEMARADAYEWFTRIGQTLPGGLGRVTCLDADNTDAAPCTPGSSYTITILWDDARRDVTGIGCDPTDANDMLCLSITTGI